MRLDAFSWAGLAALRHRFVHGRILQAASLSMVSQLLSHVIRLGGNLIMTRLLAPEMFGLMSIVVVIQVTLALLSDIGLRTATIQSHRGDDPVFLNTIWTIQVIRGFIILAVSVVIACALVVAGRYGVFASGTAWAAPELPYVLAAAALGAVIAGFQSTNYITASRNLALPRIIVVDGAGQIGGLLMMILLGVLTGSIWSLVAAGLVSAVITTTLSHTYLQGIANRFAWNDEARKEIYRFGFWVLISSTTFVLASNIDRLLLGALVSAATLGLYSIALSLSTVVEGLGTRLFDYVALPVLSEAARVGPEKLREQVRRLRLPFDLGYLASAGFIFVLGPSIISVLYDERYHDAGPILQILSLSLLFTRFGVFNMAYLGVGKPEYQAILNIVRLAAVAVLLPALYELYGLHGAIYAIALHPAAALPFYYWFNRRLGLNDLTYEVMVLPAWPAGYLAGLALIELVTLVVG